MCGWWEAGRDMDSSMGRRWESMWRGWLAGMEKWRRSLRWGRRRRCRRERFFREFYFRASIQSRAVLQRLVTFHSSIYPDVMLHAFILCYPLATRVLVRDLNPYL